MIILKNNNRLLICSFFYIKESQLQNSLLRLVAKDLFFVKKNSCLKNEIIK